MCIRNDDNIRGIKLGQNEIKQVLYANDITLFLQDRESVKRVQPIFEAFEKISDLKINKDFFFFCVVGQKKLKYLEYYCSGILPKK